MIHFIKNYVFSFTCLASLLVCFLMDRLLTGEGGQMSASDGEGSLAALHRTERSLRQALSPLYEILFERLNKHPGGLKILCHLRADLLATLK